MVFKFLFSTSLPCSKTVSGQCPTILKPQYKNKGEISYGQDGPILEGKS